MNEMDPAREAGLRAMYAPEIKAVAIIIAGINQADLRGIFVEVAMITDARDLGSGRVRPETLEIMAALKATDPRHAPFILGAAVLRNRLPEI